MKRYFYAILIMLGALAGFPVGAVADVAPDALIKNVSQEVMAIIKQDKDIQAGNQRKILDLVEAKILPNFNFTRMTRLAVGKNWRQATQEQQQNLVKEFRALLVRTYSTALSNYKDQTVDIKPVKLQPNDTETLVRTLINQPGGQPVQIDYNMEKAGDSWKVYDVIVAGVSLVTNYRSTFDRQIAESGIDGLIKTLSEKNRSLEAGQKSPGK